MNRYTKKPVTIEAVQFTGENYEDCLKFMTNSKLKHDGCSLDCNGCVVSMYIDTLEGTMTCDIGDYIIKGVKGEFYPCKPDIFELTYNLSGEGMNFGQAIEAMKQGKRVQRQGWNGKGMFVYMSEGFETFDVKPKQLSDVSRPVKFLPHIDMKSATGEIVVGWLASQTDILADDWQEV